MPQQRRSKQEEKDYQAIQALLKEPANKKCFDCPNKIPSYVNLSIQTFICSRCSGLIREVGHRVKSLTASTFSGPETVALQNGGNAVAQSIWLGHYKGTAPEPESDSDVRWFMRQKYYESKWCDQKLLKSHMEKVQNEIKELFNADGQRRPQAKVVARRQSEAIETPISGNNITKTQANTKVTSEKIQWMDDNIPVGLSQTNLRQPIMNTPIDLFETSGSTPPLSPNGPVSSQPTTLMPLSAGAVAISSMQMSPSPKSVESSLFDDLASLQIGNQPKLPSYGGGMLSPSQIGQTAPSRSPNISSKSPSNASSTLIGTRNISSATYGTSWNNADPYAVLRNFSELDQKSATNANINSRSNASPANTGKQTLPAYRPATEQSRTSQSPVAHKDQFFDSLDPFNMKT